MPILSLMQRSPFQNSAIGAAVFLMTGMVFIGMHASQGQTPPPLPLPIVTHDPVDTANGVLIQRDVHNFFSCNTPGLIDSPIPDPWMPLNRFWMYEFTGNEPPFDGEFYVSPAEISVNPIYGDPTFNTLMSIAPLTRYYVMTQADMNFSCANGFTMVPSCGDALCTHAEDLASCPIDCAVCGDGICTDPPEDTLTCPADCITISSSSSVSSPSSSSTSSSNPCGGVPFFCAGDCPLGETCTTGITGCGCSPTSSSSSSVPPLPVCGNGVLELGVGPIPSEECDDGNAIPGDGCSDLCQEEVGFHCTNPSGPGAPSVCTILIPELDSHTECDAGQCVLRPGVGTNQCVSDADCIFISSLSSSSFSFSESVISSSSSSSSFNPSVSSSVSSVVSSIPTSFDCDGPLRVIDDSDGVSAIGFIKELGTMTPVSSGYNGTSRNQSLPGAWVAWGFTGLNTGSNYRVYSTWVPVTHPGGEPGNPGNNVVIDYEIHDNIYPAPPSGGSIVPDTIIGMSETVDQTLPPIGPLFSGRVFEDIGVFTNVGLGLLVRQYSENLYYRTNFDAIAICETLDPPTSSASSTSSENHYECAPFFCPYTSPDSSTRCPGGISTSHPVTGAPLGSCFYPPAGAFATCYRCL
jgi:cysteine-rich repeat protein